MSHRRGVWGGGEKQDWSKTNVEVAVHEVGSADAVMAGLVMPVVRSSVAGSEPSQAQHGSPSFITNKETRGAAGGAARRGGDAAGPLGTLGLDSRFRGIGSGGSMVVAAR